MATPFATASDSRKRSGAGIGGALQMFSTCPRSSAGSEDYIRRIQDAARWSEAAGCAGILVWTDNSLADPWLVSQIVIQSSDSICPLVAVLPAHMHPYAVAKAVSTLAFLHGRRVLLNIVAGGLKNNLAVLHEATPRDSRYQRLVEYTRIIQQLLNERGPVTFEGDFYCVTDVTLRPSLAPELRPGILMSCSSAASMAAARETGTIAIEYPEPQLNRSKPVQDGGRYGIRIGIVARAREEDAWSAAWARFPEDRNGRATRKPSTYWAHPFETYQANCPYLVGSYRNVAEEVARFAANGYHTYVLDNPATEEELGHIGAVFQIAARVHSREDESNRS